MAVGLVGGGGVEHGTSNVLTYHQFRFRGGSDLKLEIICLSINSIYKADQCQTILTTKLKSLFRDKMNENDKLVATLQPKPTFNRKYRRLDKPPYTYVAMTTLAIQASPQRRMCLLTWKTVCHTNSYCKGLRLGEILRKIESMFPFFRNSTPGWKDSIRHNLSNNDCFVLDLKDPEKTSKNSKGTF